METYTKKSISDNLSKYDIIRSEEDGDFIEVTAWKNGEGWDITINERSLSLTIGELEAINYLTKTLDYNFEK